MHTEAKANGYRFGLRQPAQTIALTLHCPDRVDLTELDATLSTSFNVLHEEMPSQTMRDAAMRRAAAIAWRCLLVGRALLQLAHVPAFEAGRLLKIVLAPEQRDKWLVTAAVPAIDLIPLTVTQKAYAEALALMKWLLYKTAASESLAQVQQTIFERTIKPMQGMVASSVSSLPLLEAAHRAGIPFRHVHGTVYQLGYGSRRRMMDRSSIDADAAIGASLSRNKVATASCLRLASFPAPVHYSVHSVETALRAAQQLGWPVVVKPSDRERSEGVTVGINNEQRLQEAFDAARAISAHVLVEREVPGICHRLLVANGRFRYAISRKPLSITCDGTQTIAELIDARNEANNRHPPWKRAKYIELDALTLDALSANGWRPADVPAPNVKVPLRRIESSEWLGEITDVSAVTHPDNADIAERAARLFGLLNAGIDLITTDISRPWHENGAVLNEINHAPYFGGNPTARAVMPAYFRDLMPGLGRISVDVFVGQQAALDQAWERLRECHAHGLHAALTTHTQTWEADGKLRHLNTGGLFMRALALLMDDRIDALLIVIQTDELLQTGLPVDQIDRIFDSGESIVSNASAPPKSATKSKKALLDLLRSYSR